MKISVFQLAVDVVVVVVVTLYSRLIWQIQEWSLVQFQGESSGVLFDSKLEIPVSLCVGEFERIFAELG